MFTFFFDIKGVFLFLSLLCSALLCSTLLYSSHSQLLLVPLVQPRELVLVVLDELLQVIKLVQQTQRLICVEHVAELRETDDLNSATVIDNEGDLRRHVLTLLQFVVLFEQLLHLLLHSQQRVLLGGCH